MSRTFASLHNTCGADLSKCLRTLTPEDTEVLPGALEEMHLKHAEDGGRMSRGTSGVILTATTSEAT